VFVFDLPSSIDEFIHQAGRASRLGSHGWVISFINGENKAIFTEFVSLMKQLNVELPPDLIHMEELKTRKRKLKRDNTVDYRSSKSLLSLIQSTSNWNK
jgi:ATP-dependent RNA helicase DDX59